MQTLDFLAAEASGEEGAASEEGEGLLLHEEYDD